MTVECLHDASSKGLGYCHERVTASLRTYLPERKKALITGSALSIGKAMACRFAEAGADLELVDMNERGLRTVAKGLSGIEVEINIHKVFPQRKE